LPYYRSVERAIIVLRSTFGPKREEVTGGWRKKNDNFHNLYSSPNMFSVITLKRMRCAGHVGRTRKTRNAYQILMGKSEGNDRLEDGVVERIVTDIRTRTGYIWLKTETSGELLCTR
jgi:hypothetical protein